MVAILEIRAHVTCHIPDSIFDFVVAPCIWTVLDVIAVKHDVFDLVKCLVSAGADIHAQNDWAICLAAMYGHLDIVKYLVSVGADVQNYGEATIRWAVTFNHTPVIKYLMSVNKKLSTYNMYCTSDGPFGAESSYENYGCMNTDGAPF